MMLSWKLGICLFVSAAGLVAPALAVVAEDLMQYWPNTGMVSDVSEPGVNIMTNGGFENGFEGWSVRGDEWQLVEGRALEGSKSVALKWKGKDWGPGMDLMDLTSIRPNTEYRVSVKVKGTVKNLEGGGAGRVQFVFYQLDGEQKGLTYNWTAAHASYAGFDHQDDWQTLALEFSTRMNTVRFGRVAIAAYNCECDVVIDDVRWEQLPLKPLTREKPIEGVVFDGHPSSMGMAVTGLEQSGDDYTITTTGARYRISAADSTIYGNALLDAERPICRMTVDAPLTGFRLVRNDRDMAVLENEHLAMSINGDSVLLLCFGKETKVAVTNLLEAKHSAENSGNLFIIDNSGGFGFYPSKDDGTGILPWAPVNVPKEFGQPGQTAEYRFGALARAGLSLFPPKPFDWEKSWTRRAVNANWFTPAAMRYPKEDILTQMESLGITDFIGNPYIDSGSGKAWIRHDNIADPEECKAFTERAKRHNIRMSAYINVSRYGYYEDVDKVIADIGMLVKDYGIRGMYLDGLYRWYDWLKSYEFLRKLRDTVGPDGCIFLHNTTSPPVPDSDIWVFAPALDAYADYLYKGEGVSSDTEEKYLRYNCSSYHISNVPSASGFNENFGGGTEMKSRLWADRLKPQIWDEYRRIYDASLDYNLRPLWSYPTWNPETGEMGKDSWLHYYAPMEQVREARWRAGEWKPVQDREPAKP